MPTEARAAATAPRPAGELVDVLRQVVRTVAESLELQEVFTRVAEATRAVVPFDRMGVVLLDGPETVRLYAIAGGGAGVAAPVVEVGAPVPRDWLSPRLWPPASARLPRRLDAAAELDPAFVVDAQILARGARSILQARLDSGGELLGVLWYASLRPGLYTAAHETAVASISSPIALALAHERLSLDERERRRRNEALEALLPALASALDTQQIFGQLSEISRQVLPHDFLGLGLLNEDRTRVRIYASSEELAGAPPEIPIGESLIGTVAWPCFLARDITYQPGTTVVRWHLAVPPDGSAGEAGAVLEHDVGARAFELLSRLGVRSCLRVPVRLRGEQVGGLNFMSRRPDGFRAEQADLARRIADHVALALAHERLAEEQRHAAEAGERARLLEARIVRLSAELAASRLPARSRRSWRPGRWRWWRALPPARRAAPARLIALGTVGELKQVFAGRVLLEVGCPRFLEALHSLETAGWAMEVTVFGTCLHVVVADAEDGRRRIAETLDGTGNAPFTIERIVPSLEDVFIHLIESDASDAPHAAQRPAAPEAGR
jgi:GAF domain-containing protein